MYKNFGYEVYQKVYQYYSSQNGKYEDALGIIRKYG